MPSLNFSIEDLVARVRGLGPNLKLGNLKLGKKSPGRASSGPRLVTGLDIEPGQIVAAEVALNGSVKVQRAAGMPLPSNVVRDGEVVDVEGLTQALRTLFADHKLQRHVRLGVANQRIMVRTLEFPPISDQRELDAAVRFKAQDEIPMPPETVVLDYQSLGIVDTMGGPRQRVMLVAARRDMIERLLHAVQEAGLRVEGIDLAAFALIRGLHRSNAEPEEQVLHLHISGLTNLVVAKGTTCVFTRVLGTGLEAMAISVAERCAISIDEARTLLFRVGLTQVPEESASVPVGQVPAGAPSAPESMPVESQASEPVTAESTFAAPVPDIPVPDIPAHDVPAPDVPAFDLPAPDVPAPEVAASGAAHPSSPRAEAEDVAGGVQQLSPEELDRLMTARSAVADGVRLIVAEVRNSLDYHLGLGADRGVTRVVLSGPASGVPGLVDALNTDLRLPVSTGEVDVADAGASGGVPASRLVVAAGLAVAEVGR
jgi:type IV pilus assembly protein PilM